MVYTHGFWEVDDLKKVQYDMCLSESYISAEEKYDSNTPKPDLDAIVQEKLFWRSTLMWKKVL